MCECANVQMRCECAVKIFKSLLYLHILTFAHFLLSSLFDFALFHEFGKFLFGFGQLGVEGIVGVKTSYERTAYYATCVNVALIVNATDNATLTDFKTTL